MPDIRYADLVFHSDMLAFRRDDGTQGKLTRQERALLLRLCRHPRKLVTRAQLLHSMSDLSGEFGERNIDYLVNRLRKQLGDTARAPRFIATQYGEGYVWLVDPEYDTPLTCFLLIGPVFGLDAAAPSVHARLTRLRECLAHSLGPAQSVQVQPQWRGASAAADAPPYNLEISLLHERDCLHMALLLRDGRTQSAVAPFRVELSSDTDDSGLATLAQSVTQAIWAHAAVPGQGIDKPTDTPAHLRLHDAGALFSAGSSWRENLPRLERAHADQPDDPRITVMLAINRYLQLVSGESTRGGALTTPEWLAIEDEIERLALQALPQVQDNAALMFGVAKVLFFINRGHLALVERLTEQAFRRSTAFAMAFAMKGQLQAAHGNIDQAIQLYDNAIELAEPGSPFHLYLLVLKITALLAEQRRQAVDMLASELQALAPAMRTQVSLFFLSPKARQLPPGLQKLLGAMSVEDAQRLLMYLYRVGARHFRLKRHRKNVLRGAAVHLAAHFGPSAIPDALASEFPGLAGKPAR